MAPDNSKIKKRRVISVERWLDEYYLKLLENNAKLDMEGYEEHTITTFRNQHFNEEHE
jgi:hypothetical protein